VDETGRIVREVKVASEPEAVLAVRTNPTYHLKRVGLEPGALRRRSTKPTATMRAELAIELANHPEKLAAIQHKRANNCLTTPLFDTRRFTRHIEAAFAAMYERYQAGLSPDHITIPQLSIRRQ
jgi:hypothetical protein